MPKSLKKIFLHILHNEARIFQDVLIPSYMDRDGQGELVKQICKIDLELNVRMC